MSIDETKILDDLCSRFIINIPVEHRDDVVRVCFAIESAHWFYMDFYREEDQDLPNYSLKDFATLIFNHCPFLRLHVNNVDQILSKWKDYKYRVPTYGAILLDSTLTHLLFVRGFDNRGSWGFPKGKIQENESSVKCAVREVMEEVGFDIKDRINADLYLEHERNGQLIRLYIITDVPLETKFFCKMKNEIKEIRWFPLAHLPTHPRDLTPQIKLKLNAKAFFMAIPFIRDLRRWIDQPNEIFSNYRRRRTSSKSIVVQDKSSIEHQIFDKDSTSNFLTPPLSNDEESNVKPTKTVTFNYHGPKCWRKFRLNRSAIHRCLQE